MFLCNHQPDLSHKSGDRNSSPARERLARSRIGCASGGAFALRVSPVVLSEFNRGHSNAMPMNSPNSHTKPSSTDRLLSDRLRQLAIIPSGLPPHVTAHLRAEVDAEAQRIHRNFVAAVAGLQSKADEQTKKAIARLITLKTVGKTFGLPAIPRPSESPVSPHPTTAKNQGGAA